MVQSVNFINAVRIYFDSIRDDLIEETIKNINNERKVFLIAKDKASLLYLENSLSIFNPIIIDKDNSVNIVYNDPRNINLVITTPKFSAGYNLTKMNTMITSVYFSNFTTREQLEGKINRIGQLEKSVDIITLHVGILTAIFKKYEKARSLNDLLKSFAKTINIIGGF